MTRPKDEHTPDDDEAVARLKKELLDVAVTGPAPEDRAAVAARLAATLRARAGARGGRGESGTG